VGREDTLILNAWEHEVAETDTPPPLLDSQMLARLEQLELVSRRLFLGRMRGERRSPRKGQSSEFADFRQYAVGDDLRFLDWNLFARLDRLFLRLFLEEEDLHVSLLLDASLSMDFGNPSKLHFARQVAAALGFIGLVGQDRVVVEVLGGRASAPLRNRRSLWRLLDFLQQISASGRCDLNAGLRNFALRSSGKGVVVLLSDLMDKGGYEEGLRYLIARRMDVHVVHILSPEEMDPDVSGDVKLIDVEDQDETELTVSAGLVERYRQALAAYRAQVQDFCNRRGIGYLFTSTQTPFDRLVLTYFRQRGLLR
jgi:uncharacterized protein (DUF58 family)